MLVLKLGVDLLSVPKGPLQLSVDFDPTLLLQNQ